MWFDPASNYCAFNTCPKAQPELLVGTQSTNPGNSWVTTETPEFQGFPTPVGITVCFKSVLISPHLNTKKQGLPYWHPGKAFPIMSSPDCSVAKPLLFLANQLAGIWCHLEICVCSWASQKAVHQDTKRRSKCLACPCWKMKWLHDETTCAARDRKGFTCTYQSVVWRQLLKINCHMSSSLYKLCTPTFINVHEIFATKT